MNCRFAVIAFFTDRIHGVWVAILTVISVGYGWLILAAAPMWRRLTAAQDGTELQATFHYDAEQVAQVFAAFDASLRTYALLFYAVDVPNALLFGISIAALMGFGIRHLDASRTVLRWLVVLPLLSGASDLVENANLAAALLTSPSEPSIYGTLAGAATMLKQTAGYLSMALMLMLLSACLVRIAWRAWQRHRQRSAASDGL